MNEDELEISDEASALGHILRWSVDQPAWQRDALHRLALQTALDSADLSELVAICKGSNAGVPLDTSHIRDPGAGHADVTLGALYNLSHVNALAPGERLSFARNGLTVVYGDNGAGKSGYVRVLKQVCRARSPKGDTVLPNIYDSAAGIPSASVDFFIGGQKRSAQWRRGDTRP
ncbi:hypothetical protein [Tistlia consotensis]|uniref:hypothetical protein n=1 Tax=Tistlia consotensis TaxID=1321365 RepID=UPI00117E1EF8|nr:hypothetical protein [Tistlia consotensis]